MTVCPGATVIITIIITTIAPGTTLPSLQIPPRERTSLPLRDTIADGIAAAGVTIGPGTLRLLKQVDFLPSVLNPHLSPRPESCNNAGRSREKALPI